MASPVRIEIASDLVCPWCLIGFKLLQNAMTRVGGTERFEIGWHPFELNPDMPAQGENLREHLAVKYGASHEQSQENRDRITQIGAVVGFEFRFFDEMRICNTFKAHQLMYWAGDSAPQLQTHLAQALFQAYFTHGQDLSDKSVLLTCCSDVGLDSDMATEILEQHWVEQRVRDEQQLILSRGIQAVPAIMIPGSPLLIGARESSDLVPLLQKALAINEGEA